jgi:hypothetical protein
MVASERVSSEPKEVLIKPRVAAVYLDSLFLFVIVFISAAPYLRDLGFYSDDWSFLAAMSAAAEPTVGATFAALYEDEIRMRPVQVLTLATLFRLFGLEPLAYHLVNTTVLCAGVVLCYLVFRELRLPRDIALAVALLFGVLPHYSTDRFWVAAMQATLSMTLYHLGLYADLRATHSSPAGSWAWRAVAVAAMMGCVLAYEVWLPFFLLNVMLAYVQAGRSARAGGRRRPAAMRLPVLLGTTVLALLPVVLWKMRFATRLEGLPLGQKVTSFAWLLKGSAAVGYGEYGIGLPLVVVRILRRYPSAVVSATALGVAVIVFLYMWRVMREATGRERSGAAALALVGAGFGVFFLGYTLFFFTQNGQYSAAGISNRVAIAAALGVALGWVGGIVAVALPISRQRPRDAVFAGGVAAAAGTSVLIVGTIGAFWNEAYRREERILADIRVAFPDLPRETTLILDGVCPYSGPAVVFDSSWDLSGALRILYGDSTIRADVVTPNLTVEEAGLKASLYGGRLVSEYPYRGLLLYHAGLRRRFALDDAETARRYFQTYNATRDGQCPAGREGHGVSIFGRGP